MQQGGLEDYTRHKHLPAYNERVRELYAQLEPAMGDQPVYTIEAKCFHSQGRRFLEQFQFRISMKRNHLFRQSE